MKQDKLKATARLLEIMDTLREQCPWDRKQTFETLRSEGHKVLIFSSFVKSFFVAINITPFSGQPTPP